MGVQQISRFWHRRLCEASLLFSLILAGLWLWRQFGGINQYNAALDVPHLVFIMVCCTALITFALYIRPPHRQLGFASSVVYACLVCTTGVLIVSTGGLSSPFIVGWLMVAVFAMYFGWIGLIMVLLVVNGYLGWAVVTETMNISLLPGAILTGELPVLIGCLLWGPDDGDSPEHNASYKALAAQFSRVAGKSDVVLNTIRDGVLALDGEGMVELINPAAQRMVGWGDRDALGLNYQSILKLIDAKNDPVTNDTNPIASVLNHNQLVHNDRLRLVTSSGKTTLVSLVISPIGDPGDGVIVVFRDITKEKAEERQQAEFISTASHEMRNPVASIEGYLGLTLNPATATIDSRAREFIGKAHRSAEHLGRLFQDLLDISKVDDGRLQSNPVAINLIPFTNDIIEDLRRKAEAKKIQLIFKPQPEVKKPAKKSSNFTTRTLSPTFFVYADRYQLREVLDNLIDNAIKYTPKGSVIVDITGGDGLVTVSVKDTGIGIPVEDQLHLFQKFYRVDNSDTREIGGTGLGLYLSRRLIEAMDGRIWVESAYQQGSTFFVELPRLSEQAAAQLARKISPATKPANQLPLVNGSPLVVPQKTTLDQQSITQARVQQIPPVKTNQPASSATGQPRLAMADIRVTPQTFVSGASRSTRPAPQLRNVLSARPIVPPPRSTPRISQ